jgi:Raf kinase inhibitor-like YbhB/YbcL family protein
MRRLTLIVVVLLGLATACGGDDDGEEAAGVSGFSFTESAVGEGEAIAARYTCDGEDVSPGLSWEGVPEGTAELALVLEDRDAPSGTFTHWLVYGLGAGETSLPEAVPEGGDVAGPPALRQGTNDFGTAGYGGPCPPEGETHEYVFRLLALLHPLGLAGGLGREEFFELVQPHILAEAELTAPYSRSAP